MSTRKKQGKVKKSSGESVSNSESDSSSVLATGKKKAGLFFRRLLWSLLGLLVLGIIGFIIYANLNFSEGSRAGQLIKISEKGVVLKTYEGQLSLGGISTNDGKANFGNVWEFSVRSDEVYQELQTLRGKEVVVTYEEKYVALPWRGDTKYMVVEVKPLNE